MNCRILASLTWSTFPRYKSGLEWGFFIRISRKKGLEAARTPLWASNWWPSPDTRVTSGKSLWSQSFNKVCGELPWLSVDWIEIISFNNRTQSSAVGIWISMLLGDHVTHSLSLPLLISASSEQCRAVLDAFETAIFSDFGCTKWKRLKPKTETTFRRELSPKLVN